MQKKFDNVLFVGTGGGNDIFSTLLARWALESQGWKFNRASIAGVMSPFHRFTESCRSSFPGVFRFSSSSRRFLLRRGDEREVSCVDASVVKLCATESLDIEAVYGLSLENGSLGLTSTFRHMSKHFDHIFLVDVGGDIFYDYHCDHHVLSPLFDSMVLRGCIDSGVSASLMILGPGVDGELDPASLEKALYRSMVHYPLTAGAVERFEALYEQYIKRVRPGRTVPIMIEAFQSGSPEIMAQYRARNHLGDLRWYYYFNHIIDTQLCKKFYLLDPVSARNSFAVSCVDSLDWMYQTHVALRRTHSELSLEYMRTSEGRLIQFLMPSPFFDAKTRREIIHLGLTELARGACDECLLFRDDWSDYYSHVGAVPSSLVLFNDYKDKAHLNIVHSVRAHHE